MYYVNYVTREGNEIRKTFETSPQAVAYYKNNLRNMAYGYISDDEAIEVAEMVKDDYETNLREEIAEMLRAIYD